MYEVNAEGTPDYDDAEEIVKFMVWTNNQIMAMLFITNADKNRYSKVQEELENDFLKKLNNYPQTLTEAFTLLLNHKKVKKGSTTDEGIALSQRQVKPTSGIDGELHPNISCNKCKLYGHYANKCPSIAATNLFQMGVCFNQVSVENRLKKVSVLSKEDLKDLILLDCASTMNFFMNRLLLKYIEYSNLPLYLGTNNGTCVTNDISYYDDLQVWYNKHGLANVLSYALLTEIE